MHFYTWRLVPGIKRTDLLSPYTVRYVRRTHRLQDLGEFSAGESDDSGFEESVDPSDRKKEQRLENDKYDMALEVTRYI